MGVSRFCGRALAPRKDFWSAAHRVSQKAAQLGYGGIWQREKRNVTHFSFHAARCHRHEHKPCLLFDQDKPYNKLRHVLLSLHVRKYSHCSPCPRLSCTLPLPNTRCLLSTRLRPRGGTFPLCCVILQAGRQSPQSVRAPCLHHLQHIKISCITTYCNKRPLESASMQAVI